MDKIICFGKNYVDHMYELGDAPVDKPVIFNKPASTLYDINQWGSTSNLMLDSDYEIHYETELVLRIKHGGYKITKGSLEDLFDGYTIGLDMTKRKLQSQLKKNGHPWEIGKVFPRACIIAPFLDMPIGGLSEILEKQFSFSINGKQVQVGCGNQMIFKPDSLVEYASEFFEVCSGDIIFTGTPSGVGVINRGDHTNLHLDGKACDLIWN